MNNSFRLALEQFKKDARFKIGLPPEQAEHLAQQVQPLTDTLEALQARVQAIRKDGNLSTAGQNTKVAEAKAEVADFINKFADGISRHKIISDLAQRVSTKVNGTRGRARKEQPQDAAQFAQELRLHVIPKALADAKMQQIPPAQALAKMAMRAAEGYVDNMVKAEIVLQACGTGWPWVAAELSPETMTEVESIIAGQVASEEQAALQQAQGVQALIDQTIQVATQALREIG